MHRISRRISALGAVAIALGGMTACGGGSEETVAQVAGVGSISKGTLEHWMPIEARLLYQEVPTRRVPSGVVPDPPTYTACVAYLSSTPQKIVERSAKPTAAQLKDKCAQKQQELKVLTLNTLIGWDWTIGKGLQAGIGVSDAEVRQRLESLKKGDFAGVDFEKYLKYSGQTRSDMLFRSRVQLFEVKLNQQLQAIIKRLPKGLPAQQQQAALAQQAEGLARQWVAKTSCRRGYVTSSCKQYKGSLAPGIPN